MSFSSVAHAITRWSAVRLAIGLVFLLVAVVLRDVVMGAFAAMLSLGANTPQLYLARPRTPISVTTMTVVYSVAGFITLAVLAAGAYVFHAKTIEGREPSELGLRGAAGELSAGIGIGALLVGAVIGVLAAAGYVHVSDGNPWLVATPGLAAAATAAWFEELALRGLLFRIVETRLGTWLAMLLSAALFGVLHWSNANASWSSAAAIAISGGVLLGLAYVVTRRLWLAVGLHFGWNATQAGLGLAVSGNAVPGLVTLRITGPTVLTGGAFGIEASAIVIVLGLIAAGVMVRIAIRRACIVAAAWNPASQGPAPA